MEHLQASPAPIQTDNLSADAIRCSPKMDNTAAFAHREQAYQMIKQVADYLARTEPHSPVPYLLHRAFAWGHTPLPELLSELISSDEPARRLWRQLGVLP